MGYLTILLGDQGDDTRDDPMASATITSGESEDI